MLKGQWTKEIASEENYPLSVIRETLVGVSRAIHLMSNIFVYEVANDTTPRDESIYRSAGIVFKENPPVRCGMGYGVY